MKRARLEVIDHVKQIKIQKAINQTNGSDIKKEGLRMILLDDNVITEMDEKLSQTENTVICETHADSCVEEAKVTLTRRRYLHVKREARKIRRDDSASQVLWLNSLNSTQLNSMARVAGLTLLHPRNDYFWAELL